MASSSARYDEAMNVRPKGTCKSMTGSVIDERSKKYPPTCEHASDPSETNSRVAHCMTARRPHGEYRAGHGFKTIACSCGSHPCRCGTESAAEHVMKGHTENLHNKYNYAHVPRHGGVKESKGARNVETLHTELT